MYYKFDQLNCLKLLIKKMVVTQHKTHLKAGDKAPKFSAKDQDGNEISLKDFAGKKLVLELLSERQYARLHCRSLQPSRQLQCAAEKRIRSYWRRCK